MTREILNAIDNNSGRNKSTKEKADNNNVNDNYYPNCDPTIWMRSCENEVNEPINGKVSGIIPDWLNGSLLRNGPGSLKVGDYRFNHLFDSSALLHRFHVSNGAVTYQRRFVQTGVFKRNQKAKRIVLTEFGTKAVPDPCQSIFERIAAVFTPNSEMSDNSMISVYPFGSRYYTFAESPFIHQIDVETLETKDRVPISNYVGIVNQTSHPHVTSDGTVYNVGMSVTSKGPAYSVVRFPSIPTESASDDSERKMFEKASIVASLSARWKLHPSYMHTFGLTENYYIIIEQPLAVGVMTMLACKVKNIPLCTALKWHEKENTLIHVLSRKTGKLVRTFEAAAFFYLHIINQYESENGNYIVIDICCYRDAKMLECMYVDAMKNIHKNADYSKLFRARPLRFILPMTNEFSNIKEKQIRNPLERRASAQQQSDGSFFVKPELICNLGCETPRYNPKYLGRKYRYFYAISSDVDIDNPGTIIKVDTVEKTSLTWSEEGLWPSEPIFVASPTSQFEDDGIILSAAIYGRGKESEVCFLILDAKTMKEIGRTTFNTPGPVPKCLHGWFAPQINKTDSNNNNNNNFS